MKKQFIFPLLILFAAQKVSSTIIYTDLLPDVTTATNTSYNFDIDNNGTADYILTSTHTIVSGLTIGAITCKTNTGTSNYVLLDDTTSLFASSINSGDGVDANSPGDWYCPHGNPKQAVMYNVGNGQSGNYTGTGDHYMGLKFKIGSNYHYGWLRVSINMSTMAFTIKDFAYENTANTNITAGQTVTGIASYTMQNIKMILNNDQQELKCILIGEDTQKMLDISMYDITGKQVLHYSDKIGFNEINISTNQLSSGVYMVRTTMDNFIHYTNKIMISN